MAGELIRSEATAGWSRRNAAGTAMALIGFGMVVSGAGSLLVFFSLILFPLALPSSFWTGVANPELLRMCGSAFLGLFLGLWLIAHHRKISTRLFPMPPGAPLAARRAALAFGIKACAVFLAAFALTSLAYQASSVIGVALVLYFSPDPTMHEAQWYMVFACLQRLAEIAVCLYFLKRPGWLVAFAYPEGESDEDA